MSRKSDLLYYASVGAGLAMATSSFTMISGLYEAGSRWSVPIGILLAGLICMIIAASVGELASLYPSAPGIRTYLKAAFGDRFSVGAVYLYLLFLVLVGGMESFVFALVIKSIFPAVPTAPVVYLMLITVLAINWAGMELPRSAQIASTVLLVAGTLLIGVLPFLRRETAHSPWPVESLGAGGVAAQLPAVIGIAIFLFVGFEWVTPLGTGPEAYKRRIPLSMQAAILINIVMNAVFCLGLTAAVGKGEIMSPPLPQIPLARHLLGAWGGPFALLLSVCASFSTFNAGILGGSRMVYALAREGKLPKWCGRIDLGSGSPRGGVLLLGVSTLVSSTVILAFRFEILAGLVGSAIVCLIYGALMGAALRLRSARPGATRPFSSPAPRILQWIVAILIPLLGIACLFSQPKLGAKPVWVAAALLAVSFGLAYAFAKSPAKKSKTLFSIPSKRSEESVTVE